MEGAHKYQDADPIKTLARFIVVHCLELINHTMHVFIIKKIYF